MHMRNYFRIQILLHSFSAVFGELFPHLLRGTNSAIYPHPEYFRSSILRALNYFRIYCEKHFACIVELFPYLLRNYFSASCGFARLNTPRFALIVEVFPHLLQISAAQYSAFPLHLLRNYLCIYCGTISANYPHRRDFRGSILCVPHLLRNYFRKISASCGFPRFNTPRSAFISTMLRISACGFPRPNTPHFLRIICGNRSAEKLRISALFAEIWAKGNQYFHPFLKGENVYRPSLPTFIRTLPETHYTIKQI